MGRYSQGFKDRAVARLLPPESAAITTVSQEHGVSVTTLERWRAEALSRPARERAWTAAARLQALITTEAMEEAERNAWCREQGIFASELHQWRESATTALSQPHAGKDGLILAARHELYTHAKAANPRRWSRYTRNWSPIAAVTLNPERDCVVKAAVGQHLGGLSRSNI